MFRHLGARGKAAREGRLDHAVPSHYASPAVLRWPTSSSAARARVVILAFAGGLAAVFAACSPDGGGAGGAGGGGAHSDGGGGCSIVPQPEFVLTIRGAAGTVPHDTKVEVSWSGGLCGPFALDDPMTWLPLDVSNLVCDVDPANPPTSALSSLRCEIWTSGAAHVRVTAAGYQAYDRTLSSMSACPEPQTSDVRVSLEPADAGP
jgi:hypothetical protein